jgi:dihydroorotase-like cyclic amidohydrolase
MDDLVIRGRGILDGTGTDAVQGDLAIRGGRIVAITPHYAGTARREIDARGLIVVPGFIDIETVRAGRREQDPPGRDHRGDRALRVLARAGAPGSGADPAGVSRGICALNRDS